MYRKAPKKPSTPAFSLAAALLGLATVPAAAQTEAAGELFALSRLTLHGYLSQAYAISDGNQIVGIPEKGTADYRTAALQLRWKMTDNDSFAIQVSHERLGKSRIQDLHDDLELDWIFYERRFGNSGIKVGRLPIPLGIYNEIRDAGTALPLYRPARPLYEETSFATETIDGALFNHHFDLGGGWLLDADAHYGFWETYDGALRLIEAENSLGTALWLTTPLDGLRLGVGGLRFDTSTVIGPVTNRGHRQLSVFSIDGDFSRFKLQIEAKRDTGQSTRGGATNSVWGGYAYLGVPLGEKLWVHAEYDYLGVKLPNTDHAKDRERILGLSYQFRPDLVLKAEYHWLHGFRAENGPGLIPGRPVPDFETELAIVSLAVSF